MSQRGLGDEEHSRRSEDADGGDGTELREEFLYGQFAGRFVGDGQDQGRGDRGRGGEVVFFDEGGCGRVLRW